MSTWTDQLKSTGYTTGDFDFLIDDTYFFLIDNNYKLIVDETLVPVDSTWTNQTKS